jgi:hypothetical protein
VPYLSVKVPKRLAQKVSWIAIWIWPPSDSAWNTRSVSAISGMFTVTEKP